MKFLSDLFFELMQGRFILAENTFTTLELEHCQFHDEVSTHSQIIDEAIRRIPPFMIRFGVDIMTEYETDALTREKELKKLILEMLMRGSVGSHLKLKNGTLFAKSHIRFIFRKLIEHEYFGWTIADLTGIPVQ